MTRRSIVVLGLAAVLLVGGGVGAWLALRGDGVQGSPEAVADAYLDAWQEADWEAVAELAHEPPPDLASEAAAVVEGLDLRGVAFRRGEAVEEGDEATVPFQARLAVGGLGEWRYEGRLATVRAEGQWWVRWSPAALHPDLEPGDRLTRSREWPERAPILAHDGTVLAGASEVVEVGVVPQRITDREALLAALEEHLGVERATVERRLDAPGVQPDWFVPVTTLRPDEFDAVRPAVYPVPGTVFRRTTARLSPSEGFAAHVLGRTGEITAEALEELGEPYAVGDVVGLSGLERAFQARLAGQPSGEVRAVDADGEVRATLHEFAGEEPQPVTTTLDQAAQAAAEEALAELDGAAALVAVDPASGAIRAVASRPAGEFNRALAGRYAPGSTFKVVTTGAFLRAGRSPDETLDCPAEVSVGGKSFTNAGGEAHGAIPFREAFARSCNTVFAPLARDLGADALAAAAETFGFGAPYDLPLPVGGGRFPEPSDDTETAAAGIGQGRIEVSPVHMASVAAAVADGSWRPPRLVAGTAEAGSRPLEPDVASTLRELMRLVVTSGTGTAAAVPGREVAGKTGTAEFGQGDPPPTHAWFIGFDDRVAVAVLVEGGGSGGGVAAPVAARFLAGF